VRVPPVIEKLSDVKLAEVEATVPPEIFIVSVLRLFLS